MMKRIMTVLALLILSTGVYALNAQEIINKMEDISSQDQASMEYEQVVVTSTGVKTTYHIQSYSKNRNDKQLMRYLSPSKVKGTAFLMLNGGDDIWAYFSSTGRVRLIAKHTRNQKMMGSEFTYEDMSMTDYNDKYDLSLLEEARVQKKACYQIKMVPKGESAYSQVIIFVGKEDYIAYQIDFYEKGQTKALKSMVQTKIQMIRDIPTPHLIIMKNNQTGAQTVMKIIKVDYSTALDDEMFTSTALKK